jgi:hypothetical protein
MAGKVQAYRAAPSSPLRSSTLASPWYHVKPVRAIGPIVYGWIMALYSVESTVLTLHACSAVGVVQDSTGVPPQLLLMRPIGTAPPSASKTSRPKIQQTAEKWPKPPPPATDVELATDHGCATLCRSSSGTLEAVFCPTVKRRMLG